jgi:L-lactate dehydrogenase
MVNINRNIQGPRNKVTIIGTGSVGTTLAYTLMLREAASEIVLVGRNRAKAEGEALDLSHAQAFLPSPARVRAGVLEDAVDSDVVVACFSAPQPATLTDRNAMVRKNADLMREILPPLAQIAPDCKLVIVTNPVDPMTWLAIQLTGFPPERVFGTGTVVDSIRLRELLSADLSIHPDDLRAYILGEHGDKQFAAMSIAQAGGERIVSTPERDAFCERVKGFGIEIFQKKGNTSYGIAQATSYIIESILFDERRTMPLSVLLDGYLGLHDLCLSIPVVVGRHGIERYIQPELSVNEIALFHEAADTVRNIISQLKKELP